MFEKTKQPSQSNHIQQKLKQEKAANRTRQKKKSDGHVQLKQSQDAPAKGTSNSTLPDNVKGKMEDSIGADFGNVKIHPNDSSARNMGALAYTQGENVHFAPGQFEPNTKTGQELIGHELTHVVQQRQGRVKPDAVPKKSKKQFKREEQQKDYKESKEKGAAGEMQMQLKYDAQGYNRQAARNHFNSYVRSNVKQLKKNNRNYVQFQSKASVLQRVMNRDNISFGSDEYIQMASDYFPDFDPLPTQLRAESALENVNTDATLEKEADAVGQRAANQAKHEENHLKGNSNSDGAKSEPTPGQKIFLFHPDFDKVPLFKVDGNMLRFRALVDNCEVVELNSSAELLNDMIPIIKSGKTYYVPSEYCSYSVEEVKNRGTRTMIYGMVWKEGMSDDDRKIYLTQKGYSDTDIESMTKNDKETFFALLRREADNNPNNVTDILDYNTRVFVYSEPFPGWALVETDDGRTGYIKLHAVNTRLPSPSSKMHKVEEGQSLESIIDRYYSKKALKKEEGYNKKTDQVYKENDRRYYANVLLHVNNPQNLESGSIRIDTGSFSLARAFKLTDYSSYEVIAPRWMWIPDQAYADSLVGQVASGDLSQEIKEKAENLSVSVGEMVDKIWPHGFSIFYEGNVGITFGYPIGINVKMYTSFFRKDKNNIVMRRYLRGGVGLDTGVGAGIYLGMNKGLGIGAEAGAHADAMLTGYSDLEFTFPFKESTALISLMASMSGKTGVLPSGKKMFFQFLNMATDINLDPTQFLTKAKIAGGVAAHASAEARAGLTTGNKDSGEGGNRKTRTEKWNNSDRRSDEAPTFGKNILMRQLMVSAKALVASEGFVGVELDVDKRNNETKEIQEATGAVFIEQTASAGGSIPVLPLLNLDLGGVGKMVYKYTQQKGWQIKGVEVAAKSGDMDFYTGAATEISAGMSFEKMHEVKSKLDTGEVIFSDVVKDILKTVKFQKRFQLVSLPGFTNYKAIIRRQQETKSLLPSDYKKYGISLASFITLDVDFSRFVNDENIELLKGYIDEILKGFEKKDIWEITEYLVQLLSGVIQLSHDSPIVKIVQLILDEGGLTKADLTWVASGGFGFGVKAAYGAKVRVDAAAAGGLSHTSNILNEVSNLIKSGDGLSFIIDVLGLPHTEEIVPENN